MKNIVRYIVTLLAALMLIALPVYADEDTYTEGYLYYTIEDNSVVITGYFGKDAEVTVPRHIGDYPVNVIAEGAFVNTKAKVVYLPDNITEIQEGAFAGDVSVVFESPQMNTGSNEEESTLENNDNDDNSDNEIKVEEAIVEIDSNDVELFKDDDSSENKETANTSDNTKPSESTKVEDDGLTLKVNEEGQLIVVDQSGKEVVLDQDKGYKLKDGTNGSKSIVNKDGNEVQLDDSGKLIVIEQEKPNKSSGIIIGVVIVIAALIVAGLAFVKRKKKA